MATLGFLDPPKSPDQIQREGDPTTARSSRRVRLVLWGLGLASLAATTLVVMAMVSMFTSKQQWLSTLRAQYFVESVTVVEGPGRTEAVDCWTGPTINLVARIKNQDVETPTETTVAVTLSGGLDSWLGREGAEQTIVLPGSAMPKMGDTVEVPFAVDAQPWMANRPLTWTVEATGSGDEPPNRGQMATTIKPCGQTE
jgi:hypothetical protein